MGSCVSKKAARGSDEAKVAPPLPPEKDNALAPPPPPLVVVEEEVKEVLSETAVRRTSPPEPEPQPEPEPEHEKEKMVQEHEEGEASDSVSVGSSVVDKAMVKAGREQEVEKRTVDVPEKGRARRMEPEQKKKCKDAGNGRARSPSPAAKQRRPGTIVSEQPVPPRPRRESPAVVSGIGCRSGRFSPSAARRAAESAVRRSYSAREADMALPSSAKRSLNTNINCNGGSGVRRDPGEHSGRRSDSPARRPPASPAANGTISRQSSATRKGPKENTSSEKTKHQCGRGRAPMEVGDELDEAPLAGKERREAADAAMGQNPSVAMECFIFL
ncbi:uncharacterized protein [Aegilops tauschii subsp. strangulata]|uniref:Uncharacterized protein n=1 Tax=Aegilops tauschii subsp. strangulata TaxID=200361 RepID=A0A453C3P4_AEGTS|nr:DNA translocase FtsK 1 [Aegilops tauschii subsp. strangulata]XP_044328298.1 DNA translocase FtsK 1-like [Triticum aestivum]